MGKATIKRTTTPKARIRYWHRNVALPDRVSKAIGASIRPSDTYKFQDNDHDPDYGDTDTTPHVVSAASGVAPTVDSIDVTSDVDNPVRTSGVSPLIAKDPEPDEPDIDNFPPPPMNTKMRRLTDMAMVTELVVGTPLDVIAKNYNVDIRYAQRLRSEWMKACKLQETMDYRHDLKVLSLEAIRDGLQARSDPFKRMSGGIRVMQGIGEFKPDTINLNVLQRLENVPPELRQRFISSSPEEEQDAMVVEIIDPKENDNGQS